MFVFVSGEHMFMAFLGRCCTYKITETLAFHISKLYFVFSSLLVSDETEVKPLSLNLNIKLSIYKAIIKRQRVLPLYFPRLGMLWKIQHWQLKTSASACSVCPGRRGRRWRGRWGNRHGVPTTFSWLTLGETCILFAIGWGKWYLRTLNFVPRRFLYFWREPRFRMHWCRFETRVSVWSSIYCILGTSCPSILFP